jgi:hypothetical protein
VVTKNRFFDDHQYGQGYPWAVLAVLVVTKIDLMTTSAAKDILGPYYWSAVRHGLAALAFCFSVGVLLATLRHGLAVLPPSFSVKFLASNSLLCVGVEIVFPPAILTCTNLPERASRF